MGKRFYIADNLDIMRRYVPDESVDMVYADLVTAGGKVADCVQAFRQLIGPCDMLSYLVMMVPRLVECRRALKTAGSMYLHCDPAASHYLKLQMDSVFGPANFLCDSWL